jgi:hypothetical protein
MLHMETVFPHDGSDIIDKEGRPGTIREILLMLNIYLS